MVFPFHEVRNRHEKLPQRFRDQLEIERVRFGRGRWRFPLQDRRTGGVTGLFVTASSTSSLVRTATREHDKGIGPAIRAYVAEDLRREPWCRCCAPFLLPYSSSNPPALNFRVRAFSVTVLTTLSGAPLGSSAWMSRVISTFAPGRVRRCWMTS